MMIEIGPELSSLILSGIAFGFMSLCVYLFFKMMN